MIGTSGKRREGITKAERVWKRGHATFREFAAAIAAQSSDDLDDDYWFWKLVQAFWLGAFERDGYCATKLLIPTGRKESPDEIYSAGIDDDTFTREDTREAWLHFAPGSRYAKKSLSREKRALRKNEALRCKRIVEAGGGKVTRQMVRGWLGPEYSRILPERPSFERLATMSDPDTLISNRASVECRFSKWFYDTYLDHIVVETAAVKAWLKRLSSGKTDASLPLSNKAPLPRPNIEDVKTKILELADGTKCNQALKEQVEGQFPGRKVPDHSLWRPALKAAKNEQPHLFFDRGQREPKSVS